MATVELVSIEDDGYYTGELASGPLVKVTLRRGNEYVSCDSILTWEEEHMDDSLFDEWAEQAQDDVEGHAYWKEEYSNT